MDDRVLKHKAQGLWMHGQKHHLRGDVQHAIELYSQSIGLYRKRSRNASAAAVTLLVAISRARST